MSKCNGKENSLQYFKGLTANNIEIIILVTQQILICNVVGTL